ncbi:MAG: hypothetical protein J7K36_01235 [Archaeoglobaceae archaeon]|nr:hypothetical protein [Archaeoglobaceae archaeon]
MEIKLVNLGTPNRNIVKIGDLAIYFSYETPVAFSKSGLLFASENIWSKTTGSFLNLIQPDKLKRLPHKEFQQRLSEEISKIKYDIR